jgi:hypothetical protein
MNENKGVNKPRSLPGPPYITAWEGSEGTDGNFLMRAAARHQTLRDAAQACVSESRHPAKDIERSMRSLPRSVTRLQNHGYGIRLDKATNRLWITEDGETRWLAPDVADAEDQARDLADMARRYFGHHELTDMPPALVGIVADAVNAGRDMHPTLTQEQEKLVRRMVTGVAVMMCEWFARGETLVEEME